MKEILLGILPITIKFVGYIFLGNFQFLESQQCSKFDGKMQKMHRRWHTFLK